MHRNSPRSRHKDAWKRSKDKLEDNVLTSTQLYGIHSPANFHSFKIIVTGAMFIPVPCAKCGDTLFPFNPLVTICFCLRCRNYCHRRCVRHASKCTAFTFRDALEDEEEEDADSNEIATINHTRNGRAECESFGSRSGQAMLLKNCVKVDQCAVGKSSHMMPHAQSCESAAVVGSGGGGQSLLGSLTQTASSWGIRSSFQLLAAPAAPLRNSISSSPTDSASESFTHWGGIAAREREGEREIGVGSLATAAGFLNMTPQVHRFALRLIRKAVSVPRKLGRMPVPGSEYCLWRTVLRALLHRKNLLPLLPRQSANLSNKQSCAADHVTPGRPGMEKREQNPPLCLSGNGGAMETEKEKETAAVESLVERKVLSLLRDTQTLPGLAAFVFWRIFVSVDYPPIASPSEGLSIPLASASHLSPREDTPRDLFMKKGGPGQTKEPEQMDSLSVQTTRTAASRIARIDAPHPNHCETSVSSEELRELTDSDSLGDTLGTPPISGATTVASGKRYTFRVLNLKDRHRSRSEEDHEHGATTHKPSIFSATESQKPSGLENERVESVERRKMEAEEKRERAVGAIMRHARECLDCTICVVLTALCSSSHAAVHTHRRETPVNQSSASPDGVTGSSSSSLGRNPDQIPPEEFYNDPVLLAEVCNAVDRFMLSLSDMPARYFPSPFSAHPSACNSSSHIIGTGTDQARTELTAELTLERTEETEEGSAGMGAEHATSGIDKRSFEEKAVRGRAGRAVKVVDALPGARKEGFSIYGMILASIKLSLRSSVEEAVAVNPTPRPSLEREEPRLDGLREAEGDVGAKMEKRASVYVSSRDVARRCNQLALRMVSARTALDKLKCVVLLLQMLSISVPTPISTPTPTSPAAVASADLSAAAVRDLSGFAEENGVVPTGVGAGVGYGGGIEERQGQGQSQRQGGAVDTDELIARFVALMRQQQGTSLRVVSTPPYLPPPPPPSCESLEISDFLSADDVDHVDDVDAVAGAISPVVFPAVCPSIPPAASRSLSRSSSRPHSTCADPASSAVSMSPSASAAEDGKREEDGRALEMEMVMEIGVLELGEGVEVEVEVDWRAESAYMLTGVGRGAGDSRGERKAARRGETAAATVEMEAEMEIGCMLRGAGEHMLGVEGYALATLHQCQLIAFP